MKPRREVRSPKSGCSARSASIPVCKARSLRNPAVFGWAADRNVGDTADFGLRTSNFELPAGDFGRRTSDFRSAFTLIEMLVVIAIIGILAAIAVPTMNAFKPNVTAAATQQLLADIGRARQLALSERTTVYMVFVPTNFWNDPAYTSYLNAEERAKADKLLDKQYTGYNFVTLRSLGDQPGAPTVRYLSSWKTLPEGTFIPLFKFKDRNPSDSDVTVVRNPATSEQYVIKGFERSKGIPWPSEGAFYQHSNPAVGPYVTVPYLAFSYTGELLSDRDEIIPLARGSASFSRDASRNPRKGPATFTENPPGNSTNTAFTLIVIDKLTGRTHVKRQEIQ